MAQENFGNIVGFDAPGFRVHSIVETKILYPPKTPGAGNIQIGDQIDLGAIFMER